MGLRALLIVSVCVLGAACGGSSFSAGGSDDGGSGGESGGSSGGGSGGGGTTSSGSGGSSGSSSGGKGSSSGSTDAGPDAIEVCAAGLTTCDGLCTDTGTDPKNCGGCGIVCTTKCTSGVCPLIAADAGPPPAVGDNACLAIDATNVYWGTGQANGGVWKVPIVGGAASLLIGGQASPHGLASDGTTLYFANEGSSTTCSGTLEAIPISGGAVRLLASAQCYPFDLVLGNGDVYWTNQSNGSVWSLSKSNGSAVATALVAGLGSNHAAYLAVDATNVYFTDPTAGVVNRVPVGGGALPTGMTPSGVAPLQLAISSSNAYFGSKLSSSTTATVSSVALTASGAMPSATVSGLPSVSGIATDGAHIWFAESTTGQIHRTTITGSNDTILASMQGTPNCIAVDSTSVYWVSGQSGMISKTAK
jgi:hypothetical protein